MITGNKSPPGRYLQVMMRIRFWGGGVAAMLALFAAAGATAAQTQKFELRDGDRVALIGNTFVEREQAYSYLETVLQLSFGGRKISFRNLGWSGDTVYCDARGYEHDAARGFANLTKQVQELKPTVIFIGYGMVESFDGDAGLPRFRAGLERMLDMLKDLNAQIILLGPIKHENLGLPLPDPAQHNRDLRRYADAMKDVAGKRGDRFIDLFELLQVDSNRPPVTDNGIHLTQQGYARVANVIAKALNASADISSPAAEKIRQLAIQKNIQYFNQWRPANEPYIFGFRKQEQSRNQVELPRFAQPIEELEEAMRKLAQQQQVKS
jgi:lysophospholipase L1-like esterase